jgi:hypothetical protein
VLIDVWPIQRDREEESDGCHENVWGADETCDQEVLGGGSCVPVLVEEGIRDNWF